MSAARPAVCPHCGARLDEARAEGGDRSSVSHPRYDLESMAAIAEREKAYDETVKVRVTQEQIRKLVEKRGRKSRP